VLTRLLLIVLVVLAVLWWTRGRRQKNADPSKPAATTTRLAQTIVPCAHCGVHLPRHEAMPGLGVALYCSDAHRREAGDAAP
jgi:uncharacterized protein